MTSCNLSSRNRSSRRKAHRAGREPGVRAVWAFLGAIGMAAMPGCHSYRVDTRVENRTGKPVKLLEVDYPSASFGTGTLDAGATFVYRLQFRNSGPLKVIYTSAEGRQVSIDGPIVAEKQEGRLAIVLLPGGKAEFHPMLTPAN